uniref:Uncharacterized protein n=1 Tax=Peronospora matthiolae TaxID=2874970 RepID=A0AAV1UUP5_9STRA
MSGRPYARNLRAPYAGLRDLEALLPHTFRLQTPLRLKDAKYRAISTAIRRQCRQKNWRKTISIRHRRCDGDAVAGNGETACVTEKEQLKLMAGTEGAAEAEAVAEKEEVDDLEATRSELKRLEQKLQELTEQKHAKFQLLKEMLVEEARSKMTAGNGTGVSATAVNKDFELSYNDESGCSISAAMENPERSWVTSSVWLSNERS